MHPFSLRHGLKKAWPEWLVEETIARYDTDGDRMLNKEEWRKAIAAIGFGNAPIEEVDSFFDEIDKVCVPRVLRFG